MSILTTLRNLSLLLSIPIVHVFYTLLNNGDRGSSNLTTVIDHHIPFLKIFIIPYIEWYLFIFITFAYLCFKDVKVYYRTLITYLISLFICYSFYFFFQTTMVRPALAGNDLLIQLVGLIYSNDQPYNLFPSIHVLSSFLMIMGITHSRIKTKLNHFIISSQAWLIIASTVFVKQHVFLDVIGSIVLGFTIFKVVYHFEAIVAFIKPDPFSVKSIKKQRYNY